MKIKDLVRPDYFKKALSSLTFIVLSVFLLSGCSAPLKINYNPKSIAPSLKTKVPITVHIKDIKDGRAVKGEKTIGRINANVADMNSTTLKLEDSVPEIVTNAFVKEFTEAGYAVRTGNNIADDTDFIVSGEVKNFSLDIGARDKINIEVATEVIEKETGKVLWAGTGVEKTERFAGVMGNTRATISNNISVSLAKVIRNVINEVTPRIANTRAAYAPKTAEPTLQSVDPLEAASPSDDIVPAPEGTGRVVINTTPERSKVYVGDIYYGLTPLTLDIDPGVYEFTIKQKGFKQGKEKVSVRKGQFTELEVSLDKE